MTAERDKYIKQLESEVIEKNFQISELDRLIYLIKFTPVLKEQLRQITKWGIQNHDPCFWLTILAEEFGEVAEAILETKVKDGNKTWKDVIKE
ncbi:hypothetical protein LCGC14_2095540, partial [marine sediment metagenome]